MILHLFPKAKTIAQDVSLFDILSISLLARRRAERHF
jgi:hypothetical protein